MNEILDIVLHLPEHLDAFTQQHGFWIYVLLFVIVFCETGLVVTPFLPGDSLLFAVGAIAMREGSGLNVWLASAVLLVAAILGDTLNYWIGHYGSGWAVKKFPRLIKQEHLDKTGEFYKKYGGKTIIIARFVPIVRTFAPFVAGSGSMNYGKFMFYNVIGAILWVGLLVPAGAFLGQFEFVKKNFEIVVLAIIAISVLPMVIEWLKERSKAKKSLPVD